MSRDTACPNWNWIFHEGMSPRSSTDLSCFPRAALFLSSFTVPVASSSSLTCSRACDAWSFERYDAPSIVGVPRSVASPARLAAAERFSAA